MADPTMAEINPKLEALANAVTAYREQGEKEIKAAGEMSKETAAGVKKLEEELTGLKVVVEKMQTPAGTLAPAGAKSMGQQFIESKAYADMLASGAQKSLPVAIKGMETKDIVASRIAEPVVGVPVDPHRVPGVIMDPWPEARVVELISQSPTTSNAIEYVKATYTRAAKPVKESITSAIVSKPQAKLAFSLASETVKTIPVWIPASRQILADAPALQSLINNQLTMDVNLKVEEQVLFGTGVDPELHGIVPQAEAYDTTLTGRLGLSASNVTRIDHLRASILQVRQSLYTATAIVLNPLDWAAIELTKDTTGGYIWVSVTDGGVARMWRLPVVTSTLIEEKQFLTGAFALGATLYNREAPTIRISDSHSDFFTSNLVAILCELRCALTVTRPPCFVTGTFD